MKYILTLLCSLITCAAYSQTLINNEKVFELLRENQSIQLVDVRTASEYDTKHLFGAVNIDWKNSHGFDSAVVHLDKNKPLYIYCLSGGRSAKAAQKLTALGFQVFDIEGGIAKWETANLPLRSKSKIREITNIEDYKNSIQHQKTTLAYFYVPKNNDPEKVNYLLEDVLQDQDTEEQIITIDVNKHKKLIDELNITSFPTLIIYNDGLKIQTYDTDLDLKTIEKQLKIR